MSLFVEDVLVEEVSDDDVEDDDAMDDEDELEEDAFDEDAADELEPDWLEEDGFDAVLLVENVILDEATALATLIVIMEVAEFPLSSVIVISIVSTPSKPAFALYDNTPDADIVAVPCNKALLVMENFSFPPALLVMIN